MQEGNQEFLPNLAVTMYLNILTEYCKYSQPISHSFNFVRIIRVGICKPKDPDDSPILLD